MTSSAIVNREVVLSAKRMNGASSVPAAIAIGFGDIRAALVSWRLWSMLGWNDIRQRYRRSTLGPFWITLSMAVFVLLLGFIYSKIFNQDIAVYLPYIAGGLIIWGFISGSMLESSASFIEATGIIKQLQLPFSLYVMRTVWRAAIVLLHTAVLMVVIWLAFGMTPTLSIFLVIPGVALVFLNQIWVSIVIAVLSTRFRDVVPIVQTAVQISMFATPIMWPISALSEGHYIADLNPLYHLIELVRAPLLATAPATLSWIVVIGLNVVGFVAAAWLLGRSRHRIVYWL